MVTVQSCGDKSVEELDILQKILVFNVLNDFLLIPCLMIAEEMRYQQVHMENINVFYIDFYY